MKKFVTGIAVMAAALFVNGASIFAAELPAVPGYMDADGDGICDYCGVSCSFVDADGDGICDNYAALCGMGTGYVDADGVCDYYGTYGCGMGNGYVDADGDGVCDYYGTYGCGRGGRGGCGRGRGWR